MDVILTSHPPSQRLQERLAALAGPQPLWLTASDLRRRSLWQAWKYLRSLRVERVFVAVEEDSGAALLPVLQLLASVVPAADVRIVDDAFATTEMRGSQVLISLASLGRASAEGMLAKLKAKSEVDRLLGAKRIVPRSNGDGNVVYLNANLSFGTKVGGSIGHISGVINGLLDEHRRVKFLSAGGRMMARPEAQYVPLRCPEYLGIPPEYTYYRFHFDVVHQIRDLIEPGSDAAIYQRMSSANYSGVVASRRTGVPLVIEYNGSEAWVARNWGRALVDQALAEKVEDVNLRHAHLVVTVSSVLRDELLKRGVPEDRVVTYPNCIDPQMFDPARFTRTEVADLRRRYGISDDAVVLTFIGTFGRWHGAEVLAEAIRGILDADPEWVRRHKLRVLLVGDGLRMPEVRQILGAHASGPFITLPGLVPQRDAPLHLAASDILSAPHVPNADGSPFFGSPTKLFEYMAMGKAIVASDLDQIGDVLANSVRAAALPPADLDAKSAETGGAAATDQLAVLCRAGSVEDLGNSIRFLVERPGWRAALGANARREALSKYTWQHHVKHIVNRLKVIVEQEAS